MSKDELFAEAIDESVLTASIAAAWDYGMLPFNAKLANFLLTSAHVRLDFDCRLAICVLDSTHVSQKGYISDPATKAKALAD